MAKELNVISRKHLCEQLGISSKTIKRWITNRNFPEPMKASGQESLFDDNAVKNWFEKMEARDD
ncbi:MAG: helix-turn-helix domain-containing protein [Proteobacteria bacterium]|nr:helix-turn-helix domain-containing protein [Pseudomonadota bacterium]